MPVQVHFPNPVYKPTFEESFRRSAGEQVLPLAAKMGSDLVGNLFEQAAQDRNRAFAEKMADQQFERELTKDTFSTANRDRLQANTQARDVAGNLGLLQEQGRQAMLGAEGDAARQKDLFEWQMAMRLRGGVNHFARAQKLASMYDKTKEPSYMLMANRELEKAGVRPSPNMPNVDERTQADMWTRTPEASRERIAYGRDEASKEIAQMRAAAEEAKAKAKLEPDLLKRHQLELQAKRLEIQTEARSRDQMLGILKLRSNPMNTLSPEDQKTLEGMKQKLAVDPDGHYLGG